MLTRALILLIASVCVCGTCFRSKLCNNCKIYGYPFLFKYRPTNGSEQKSRSRTVSGMVRQELDLLIGNLFLRRDTFFLEFYCCTMHYWIYILFTHQQMHFLLNLEEFKFTWIYTYNYRSYMFRSSTILRELVQSLANVTLLLKHSVKLRCCILCGDVAACCHISTQYTT